MASDAPASKPQPPPMTSKPSRLPAPTLFVGPPSRAPSQRSVTRTTTDPNFKSSRETPHRQKSYLSRPVNSDQPNVDSTNDTTAAASRKPRPHEKTSPQTTKPSDSTIDAKWREMQSTLNEVELTAQSTTHVFGTSHAAALEDLRRAQIALARAWGRGNQDQATAAMAVASEPPVDRFKGAEEMVSASPSKARSNRSRPRADTDGSGSTNLSDESALTDSDLRSGSTGRNKLEDETAQDIKLAGERRAANEAYFKKVDQSVKEVVAKLEKVAEAMRGVEAETRSLWSQSDRSSIVDMDDGKDGAGAAVPG